jgi:hypothetical protein
MNKRDILDKLWRSPMIEDMLVNITYGNPLKEDLKSELFLILMEMPDVKIIAAHNGNWLTYLCVNILKKMWRSNTSPFYKKWRKGFGDGEPRDMIMELDDFDYEKLDLILGFVDKLPFVEQELFKMRYKIGKYDKWFGELRDKDCKKSVYSYRKIENKLAIETKNGEKPITIDHSTVEKYHKRSIERIKKMLKKYE